MKHVGICWKIKFHTIAPSLRLSSVVKFLLLILAVSIVLVVSIESEVSTQAAQTYSDPRKQRRGSIVEI